MNKNNQHCSEWISKLDRSPVGGPNRFLGLRLLNGDMRTSLLKDCYTTDLLLPIWTLVKPTYFMYCRNLIHWRATQTTAWPNIVKPNRCIPMFENGIHLVSLAVWRKWCQSGADSGSSVWKWFQNLPVENKCH